MPGDDTDVSATSSSRHRLKTSVWLSALQFLSQTIQEVLTLTLLMQLKLIKTRHPQSQIQVTFGLLTTDHASHLWYV
jgi:hypothetical protein